MTARSSSPNVPAPQNMNAADIMAILQGTGAVETQKTFRRLKNDGLQFIADNDIYFSNPKTNEPAAIVQIVKPPRQYQMAWFDADGALARAVGRPEMAGQPCKSWHDIPEQAREFAEDGTSCRACPINPFARKDSLPIEAKGQKCKWRGDIEIRFLDEERKLVDPGEPWTLSLPTTGMIEFQGIKGQSEGSVSDASFMFRLASMAPEKFPDVDPKTAVLRALTALSLGGVIAELRSIPAQNDQSGNRYHVIQFIPIDILDVTGAPALESGEAPAADAVADDDIPF